MRTLSPLLSLALALALAVGCESPEEISVSNLQLSASTVACPGDAGMPMDGGAPCVAPSSSRQISVTVSAQVTKLQTNPRALIEVVSPAGSGKGPWTVELIGGDDDMFETRVTVELPPGPSTTLRLRVAGAERTFEFQDATSSLEPVMPCASAIDGTSLTRIGATVTRGGAPARGASVTFGSLPELSILPTSASTNGAGEARSTLLRERDGGVYEGPVLLEVSTSGAPPGRCVFGADGGTTCMACPTPPDGG